MAIKKDNPFNALPPAEPGPSRKPWSPQPFRNLHPHLFALLALCLFSLVLWSCNTNSPDDVYTVTFKLDSTRVGKFDSVLVQIYNGKAPGPGDTNQAVQVEVIKLTPTTKEVTVELNSKVKKDFSVVITGFSGKEIAYRNLHIVDGFATPDTSNPSVLLISRIQAEDLTLSVGETRAPALTFTPANAGDKRFVLVSKDSAIAKVVGDSLKGLKAGRAKVFASTPDFSVTIDFSVNVVNVRVTVLKTDSLFLKVGDSLKPPVTVLPDNATDPDYRLESSDSTVLQVAGKSVKALKPGKVHVLMIANDGGVTDTFYADVRIPVTALKGNNLVKETGDMFAPVLEWTPSDATIQKYTLESKDTNNVAVRGDSLEAKAIGAVKITATSEDGKFKAEFEVDVRAKVFRVKSIQAENLRGLQGDTLDAKLTWDPANASDQGFILKSMDSATASIVDGKIIPKLVGKTNIEVTSTDGAKKATFELSVELANFKADILPITSTKCAPCHVPPTATFNWTDSVQLVRKGGVAIDRLTRSDTAAGKMPLVGATGGPLGRRDLNVLLGWLARVAISLKSITITDTVVNLGDTVVPDIVFTPANASDKVLTLSSQDSSVVVVRGGALVPVNMGSTSIDVVTDEGGLHVKFKITVGAPLFQKNILPITSVKCFPCHGPGTTFNWQDSISLISDGSNALDRLQRDIDAAGRMPLKVGAPNGDLTPTELHVLLTWLNSKVVPLKGISVPNDSVKLGSLKAPAIVYTPANATNKAYELISSDTNTVALDGNQFVGRALGSTTVLVRAFDGNFSKQITVKVIPVAVDSVTVNDTAGAIGDTVVPRVNFFPANATNQAYTIALLKPSAIIKVDAIKKAVIGLSIGKDTLEATSTDGSKKGRIIFTVGPVLPKSLSIPDTNGTGSDLVSPRLIWTPASTTDKTYSLSIPAADTLIAAVRGGQILCKSVGTVAAVTATSTADANVKATFKFTVGPVPVQSITVATRYAAIGATFAPVITFIPANATNKNYTLTLAGGDTNMTVSGGSLFGKHLDSTKVTITTQDGAKTALWTVVVTRPPWGAVKALVVSRCDQCHAIGNASHLPTWEDSVSMVALTPKDYPATIIGRVTSTGAPMPPTNAVPTPGPLQPGDISIIVNWLNTK
ncbi:MAG: hypothetical protein JWO30_1177 [Fibrobacteres bacterium]|nr:hypothetical protein [Fibrobacterota bacterium]